LVSLICFASATARAQQAQPETENGSLAEALAFEIDKQLNRLLPEHFEKIEIE